MLFPDGNYPLLLPLLLLLQDWQVLSVHNKIVHDVDQNVHGINCSRVQTQGKMPSTRSCSLSASQGVVDRTLRVTHHHMIFDHNSQPLHASHDHIPRIPPVTLAHMSTVVGLSCFHTKLHVNPSPCKMARQTHESDSSDSSDSLDSLDSFSCSGSTASSTGFWCSSVLSGFLFAANQ